MGGSSPSPPRKPPPEQPCPDDLQATLAGPADGIMPNSWLDVVVEDSGGAARVLVVDPFSEETVGSLAGIPHLAVLVRCLRKGEKYRAFVEAVDGGRVDVTVTRQV